MLLARWQIDAKFGYKQSVIDLMRRWERDIGNQAGVQDMEFRLLSGSVGAREATVEVEHTVQDLAQLERFFDAIGKIDAHKAWGKEMEPHVVSGSSKWTIFRIL